MASKWRKFTVLGGAICYKRAGKFGGLGFSMGGAHSVKNGWNYNGSSKSAFGGAAKWPVVTAQVSFPEGQDAAAARFAEQVKTFIDSFFEKEE